MSKKLILICGTLESGGAERVISILSTPFADYFNEVSIITWRSAPVFYNIDARVRIISLPDLAKSNNDIKKGIVLRTLVKRERPDIVLSFLTLFNLFTLISLFGTKVPIIVAERNDPRFTKGGILVKIFRDILYKSAKGILCQTKSISNYFNKTLQSKTHIIYNPVILPAKLIGAATSTTKKNRIVSIGRLHQQKNQKLLIDSFYSFHKTHPDYCLTIYGTGNLKQYLLDYIKSLGLSDSVELAGEKKNVQELILDAKIFVLTSIYEGMPNALIEAMCLGLPCISTKVSGAVDLISDGHNGFLVEPDSTEISRCMSLIADDRDKAKSISIRSSELYNSLKVEYISKLWIDYLINI